MKRFNPNPCPEPGDGVHSWFLHAAHCAVKAGMTDEQAIEEITLLATREPRWNEIEDALSTARRKSCGSAPTWSRPNPGLIARVAKGGPTLLDLIARSPQPIRFGERSRSEEILDALFPGNPLLCSGKSKSKVSTVPREVCRGLAASESLIVPSPMSAEQGRNKKGRMSRRCEANTGPRRFLIVEFDRASLDQQAALLWHLTNYAPLALVVFSGIPFDPRVVLLRRPTGRQAETVLRLCCLVRRGSPLCGPAVNFAECPMGDATTGRLARHWLPLALPVCRPAGKRSSFSTLR